VKVKAPESKRLVMPFVFRQRFDAFYDRYVEKYGLEFGKLLEQIRQ
jgi:hypothetical protein